MFPAGPSKEYLNKGVFRLRGDAPCALYALEVTDDAYVRARRRAEHMMARGELYRFNTLGLILCALHIRWQAPSAASPSQPPPSPLASVRLSWSCTPPSTLRSWSRRSRS